MKQKTLLIGGVVAIGAILFLSAAKRAQQNALAYRNQPGLMDQPGVAAQSGLSQIIYATSSGLSNFITDQFSKSGDLNDPGLDSNEPTDFPGMDYTYDNSNSYSVNYGAISDAGTSSGWDTSASFDEGD